MQDEEAHNVLLAPEEESPEEEVGAYADRRWRRIFLIPHGADWDERLQRLVMGDDLVSVQERNTSPKTGQR